MNMVWATWDKFAQSYIGFFTQDLPRHIIQSVDQCMSMSDAALRYGCDIDNSIAFSPRRPNPLFRVVDEFEIGVPRQAMMDALRYL